MKGLEFQVKIEQLIAKHVDKWKKALEQRGAKVTLRGIEAQRDIQRALIDVAIWNKSKEEKEAWLNSKLST